MQFKLKLEDQTIIVAAWYGQGKLLIEIREHRNKGVGGEVDRIKLFKAWGQKAKQMSKNHMFLGDINIYMIECSE